MPAFDERLWYCGLVAPRTKDGQSAQPDKLPGKFVSHDALDDQQWRVLRRAHDDWVKDLLAERPRQISDDLEREASRLLGAAGAVVVTELPSTPEIDAARSEFDARIQTVVRQANDGLMPKPTGAVIESLVWSVADVKACVRNEFEVWDNGRDRPRSLLRQWTEAAARVPGRIKEPSNAPGMSCVSWAHGPKITVGSSGIEAEMTIVAVLDPSCWKKPLEEAMLAAETVGERLAESCPKGARCTVDTERKPKKDLKRQPPVLLKSLPVKVELDCASGVDLLESGTGLSIDTRCLNDSEKRSFKDRVAKKCLHGVPPMKETQRGWVISAGNKKANSQTYKLKVELVSGAGGGPTADNEVRSWRLSCAPGGDFCTGAVKAACNRIVSELQNVGSMPRQLAAQASCLSTSGGSDALIECKITWTKRKDQEHCVQVEIVSEGSWGWRIKVNDRVPACLARLERISQKSQDDALADRLSQTLEPFLPADYVGGVVWEPGRGTGEIGTLVLDPKSDPSHIRQLMAIWGVLDGAKLSFGSMDCGSQPAFQTCSTVVFKPPRKGHPFDRMQPVLVWDWKYIFKLQKAAQDCNAPVRPNYAKLTLTSRRGGAVEIEVRVNWPSQDSHPAGDCFSIPN